MTDEQKLDRRNPGPSWGFALMAFGSRVAPKPLLGILVQLGGWISMISMREERICSKRYLGEILKRDVSLRECARHFTAFAYFLVRRLRVADGYEPTFRSVDGAKDRLEGLLESGKPTLCGTFHYGNADLMGFWLSHFNVSVRMVRYKVGNSNDLKWLESRFGETVRFIWVNEKDSLLFALKDAIEEGHSIAMKCDRAEHSSKLEAFDFLGRRRLFPFTIYHMAILFDLPVVFALGRPRGQDSTDVHCSSIFQPDQGVSKEARLEAARVHFEEVLQLLESLLQEDPFQWFNFLEALPLAPETDLKGEQSNLCPV